MHELNRNHQRKYILPKKKGLLVQKCNLSCPCGEANTIADIIIITAYLLVTFHYTHTTGGLSETVKCIPLNKGYSFAILLQSKHTTNCQ